MYSKARGGIKTGAKEYLQQLRRLSVQIEQREEQLEELRMMILSASDPSQEHVSGGQLPDDSSVVRYIAHLEEKEREIKELLETYLSLKARIIDEIQSLPNPLHIQILYQRYVEYKKLEQIAIEMNYSYSYVKRMHRSALREFERGYPMILF